MSDALERIVPFDKKGELYRHSAEGLDDMPVCIDLTRQTTEYRATILIHAGSYQILLNRFKRYHSHIRRQIGDRHMARNLVLGISDT